MTSGRGTHFADGSRTPGPSLEAFFSHGFRPFFLGAATFAVLLMGVWILYIALAASGHDVAWHPASADPFAWHAHEMVFGFAAAAIAGFLLTAVPNWTGALPLSGAPLVVLFLSWLAGRCAMMLPADFLGSIKAAIDLAFLPMLGAFAGHQLMVRPAPRNLVFLALIAALTLLNAAYHAGIAGYIDLAPVSAGRGALLIVLIMIAIIGGRIVPAFTHNWLHLNAPGKPMPRRIAWLDATSIGSVVAFVMSVVFDAPSLIQGTIALAAAVLNAIRLVLWRGYATWREPIVWVLHAAYAWLVAGLTLSAASTLGSLPPSLAFHAFGAGAAGTMIMAVMSRASLGHTGRPLTAPPKVVWAYYSITLAALLRVAGPLALPQSTPVFLTLAGIFWIGAFGLFVIVYAPILTTPRVHMKTA